MNAREILENYPSVKLGLDDHYGKQTVLNALNEVLNKLTQAERERDELMKEQKDLKKRFLIALEFIHSLAIGMPMGFWRRTNKAGEVLKKINP